MFSDEELLKVPYEDFSAVRLSKLMGVWHTGREFKKWKRSLLNRCNVRTLQEAFFIIRRADIFEKYEQFTTLEGVSSFYGVSKDMWSYWTRKLGMWPSSCSQSGRMSIADRLREDRLFMGPAYSQIESYVYGYYLGDGSSGNWKGKPTSLELRVCNPLDESNLKAVEKALAVGPLVVCRGSGKFDLRIYSRAVVKRLLDKKLLFKAKGKDHPKFDLDRLRGFNKYALIRGLIDSDGWLNKNRTGRNQLCICGTWENLLEVIEQWLLEEGIQVRWSYDDKRESSFGSQPVFRITIKYEDCCKLVERGFYESTPLGVGLERKRFYPR